MNEEYAKLSEVLPLEAPFTLMIDPSNACNFKCTFCPTGDTALLKAVSRPLGIMDYNLFCKVIDDLTGFKNKIKSLRLYKDGEPFLNRNLVKMVRYAKQKNVAEEIYIITNGSLITKEIASELVDSGLDRIRISVEHVDSEHYKRITQTFSNYEKIVENAKNLYEEKKRKNSRLYINVKILDTGLTKEEIEKFKRDFGQISDSLTIETLMGWSLSDAKDWTLGINPETGIDGKTKLADIDVCPEPFKGLAINFDGSVSVCCVDWSHGTVVGDAKKENFVDIWNGEKLRTFRLMHLTGKRKLIEACANCQYLKGHKTLSHLDSSKKEIIPLYTNNTNEILVPDQSWAKPLPVSTKQ